MSFLKKALASLSIGAAQVNAAMDQSELIAGQPAQFSVTVTGGLAAQQVDQINLHLCCEYRNAEEDADPIVYVLQKWVMDEQLLLEPNQQQVFKGELTLPYNTPLSLGSAQVWLETGLDIPYGIDPLDRDILVVRPDLFVATILDDLSRAGLQLRQVSSDGVEGFTLPFMQVFEFVPVFGEFLGQCRVIEIAMWRSDEQLQLWLEKDRVHRGLTIPMTACLNEASLVHKLTLRTTSNAEAVTEQLLTFIQQS